MTEELFIERSKLREAINAELVEFTGDRRDFIWTDYMLTHHGRRWHEFKVIDTQMTMFVAMNEDGTVTTVNEVEEIFNS